MKSLPQIPKVMKRELVFAFSSIIGQDVAKIGIIPAIYIFYLAVTRGSTRREIPVMDECIEWTA